MVASVLEHVDAENDVVFLLLELNVLEVHDAVLIRVRATPALSL